MRQTTPQGCAVVLIALSVATAGCGSGGGRRDAGPEAGGGGSGGGAGAGSGGQGAQDGGPDTIGGGGASGSAGGPARGRCSTFSAPIRMLSVAEAAALDVRAGGQNTAIVQTGDTIQVVFMGYCGPTENPKACAVARTLTRDANGDLALGALSSRAQLSTEYGRIVDAVVVGSTLRTWSFALVSLPGVEGEHVPLEEISFTLGPDGQVTAAPPVVAQVPLPPSCLGDIWSTRATTDENGAAHIATACQHPVEDEVWTWISEPSAPGGWLQVGDPQGGPGAPKWVIAYQHMGGVHHVFASGTFPGPDIAGTYVGTDEPSLRAFHPLFPSDRRDIGVLADFVALPGRAGLFALVTEAAKGPKTPAAVYTGLYRPADYGKLRQVPAAGLNRVVELPAGTPFPYFIWTTAAADGSALSQATMFEENGPRDELWCWGSDGKLVKQFAVPSLPRAGAALSNGRFLIIFPARSSVDGQTEEAWAQEIE
jgi:hypothetical protein